MATAAQPKLVYHSHAVNGIPNGQPEPGDSVDLLVTLRNEWGDAGSVQAILQTTDPNVTLMATSASYGAIATYARVANAAPLRFTVKTSAPYGHAIAFNLRVTADGGYVTNLPVTVTVAPGVTYVHGTLTTQTWTSARKYVVDNNAGVAAGHTLTIQPGTVIRFAGDYSLNVAGTLIANGTEAQPIRFTADNCVPGAWGQIIFLDSSTDATFDSDGDYVSGSILRHTVVECGDGLNLQHSAPYLSHNTLVQINGDAISGAGSAGLVVEDNVLRSTGISLSLAGGGSSIQGNSLYGATMSVSGSGSVSGNDVSGARLEPGTGIAASGSLVLSANRVVNCRTGMDVGGGILNGNLIANNLSTGLSLSGSTSVLSNTIVFNRGAAVRIVGGSPTLHANNLIAKSGQYALRNDTANVIDATSNWWGVTSAASIQSVIYDGSDEFGKGVVDAGGPLTGSVQDAPAYVRSVTLTPETMVGIQRVTFEMDFSRPMEQGDDPVVVYYSSQCWTGKSFGEDNAPLNQAGVWALALAEDGSLWVNSQNGAAHYDGSRWTEYSSHPLDDGVRAIAVDARGTKWFGTAGGVVRFDDHSTTVYTTSNSGLPHNNVHAVAVDSNGAVWFGTDGGAARFGGGSWSVYTASNSGLLGNTVSRLAGGPHGEVWAALAGQRVAIFDGSVWTAHVMPNPDLSSNTVQGIAVEDDGTAWFATSEGGVMSFDGNDWHAYNVSNSALPSNNVLSIAVGKEGSKWFGTVGCDRVNWSGCDDAHNLAYLRHDGHWSTYSLGACDCGMLGIAAVAQARGGLVGFGFRLACPCWSGATRTAIFDRLAYYSVSDNASWTNSAQWRATYDITSLVSRDTYIIQVDSVRGQDGIEIAPDTRFGFSVDYAGSITDQTPPNPPSVFASGKVGNSSYVEATWNAHDAESAITLYRYAIGNAPGATDIVNWTNTTSTSFARGGLGLVKDRRYHVAVQARNTGGLWSASGVSPFIAGQRSLPQIAGAVTSGGKGLAGVTIQAGPLLSVTTNVSGTYTITNLVAGTYRITPTLAGYRFNPVYTSVTVPPHAAGVNFVGVRWFAAYLPVVLRGR